MNNNAKAKEGKTPPSTYGVLGLMEWNALIPVGRSTLRVHFSGGTVTGFGVTPAKFTTDNPAVQLLIEQSHWFRSGRIFRIA